MFVGIYICGRWYVLRAIILLKPLSYELGIRQQTVCSGVLLGKFAEFTEHLPGVYGASQTQKAQRGERIAPPTPALMVESALAPQSAMEYSSGLLRGPELPVTGPTSAISYPILI